MKRTINQDRCLVRKYPDRSVLFAVADGAGGHKGGHIAAEKTIQILDRFRPADGFEQGTAQLCQLISIAQIEICDIALHMVSVSDMATTLAVGWANENRLFWAYLGDTRIYRYRQGTLTCLTRDHTIPGLLVKEGRITREAARSHPMRHGILKCIGGQDAEPDTGTCDTRKQDIFFACSDGLHDLIPESLISDVLAKGTNLDYMALSLVDLAIKAGGDDNITIAGVRM